MIVKNQYDGKIVLTFYYHVELLVILFIINPLMGNVPIISARTSWWYIRKGCFPTFQQPSNVISMLSSMVICH